MDVGREIRRLREAKGWSQAKLAGAADMGVSGVSQIETGARNPSAVTLAKIAAALDVEVGELFPKGQSPLPLDPASFAISALDRWFQERGAELHGLPREEFLARADAATLEELEEMIRAFDAEWEALGLQFVPEGYGSMWEWVRSGDIKGSEHSARWNRNAHRTMLLILMRDVRLRKERLSAQEADKLVALGG